MSYLFYNFVTVSRLNDFYRLKVNFHDVNRNDLSQNNSYFDTKNKKSQIYSFKKINNFLEKLKYTVHLLCVAYNCVQRSRLGDVGKMQNTKPNIFI